MYVRFFFFSIFMLMPFSALAATYSFAEGTSTDSTGKHEIVLLLSVDTPVNAIQGVFMLPDSEKDVEISDGGSIVQFWIEHPHEVNGKVSFAGVIPGGFSGEAPVLRFSMKGSAKTIMIDKKEMVALRHDGTGASDPVVIGPIVPLPVHFASTGYSDDARAPQPFTPVIAEDPALFEGKPFVSFGTKDDESGVVRYEMAESVCGLESTDARLSWHEVSSPAPLQNISMKDCVYVRAIDKEGNVRVASISLDAKQNVPPEEVSMSTARNLYKSGIVLGIIIVTLGGVFFWLRRRKTFSK